MRYACAFVVMPRRLGHNQALGPAWHTGTASLCTCVCEHSKDNLTNYL